jgi:hypothetical protein
MKTNASVVYDIKSQRYLEAVARVRRHDDKTYIGMCSNAETERLEKLASELEKLARVSTSNEPITRALNILSDLWRRYHQASSEVLKWQAEILPHRPQLAIIGAPIGFFQEPEAIASAMPSFSDAAECEKFNTGFGHKVMDLETKARMLKEYTQQWTRLTLEQQNRKLIMAIYERI